MTIIAPDWGAALGQALAGLGSGVKDIINPNADFHKKIREAIATNPEVGQGLADLLHTNGGVLPAVFAKALPKDVLDAVYKITPSPEAIATRAATRAAGDLTPTQMTGVGQGRLLKTSPVEAAKQLAQAPLVAGVAAQTPGTPPRTVAEQGVQGEVGGLTAGRSATDVITAQLAQPAKDWLTDLKARDAEKGTDFFGRVAAEHFSLLDDEHFLASIAEREKLAKDRNTDRTLPIQMRESDFWVNKSGLGDPEMWRGLLYDPKVQAHLDEIKRVGPKTEDDRTLLRMESFKQSLGANAERGFYIASSATRDKMIEYINGNPAKKILPDDEARRPGHLATLNAELARERVPVEAFWGTGLPNGEDIGKAKLRFRLPGKNVEIGPEQMFKSFSKADEAFTSGGGGGFDVPRVTQPSSGAEPAKPKPKPNIELPMKPAQPKNAAPTVSGSLPQRRADYANQLIRQGLPPAVARVRAMNEIQ